MEWVVLMRLRTCPLFFVSKYIFHDQHSYTDTACGFSSPSCSLASSSSLRSIPFRARNRMPKQARRILSLSLVGLNMNTLFWGPSDACRWTASCSYAMPIFFLFFYFYFYFIFIFSLSRTFSRSTSLHHQEISHRTKNPFFRTKFSTSSFYVTLSTLILTAISLKRTMRGKEKRLNKNAGQNPNLQDKVSGKRNSNAT